MITLLFRGIFSVLFRLKKKILKQKTELKIPLAKINRNSRRESTSPKDSDEGNVILATKYFCVFIPGSFFAFSLMAVASSPPGHASVSYQSFDMLSSFARKS